MHSWLLRPSGLVRSPLLLNRRRLTFVLQRMLSMPLNPLPCTFLVSILDQLQHMHADFGSCLDHLFDEMC